MNLKGLRIPTGRRQTNWLLFKSVAEDLNSGLPWTNPAAGQSGTWTRRPRNCKFGVLTTRPRCHLLKHRKTLDTFHGLLISEKVALGSASQVYCLAMQNLCNFEIIKSLLFFYVLFADGGVNDSRSNTSIKKQFRNYKSFALPSNILDLKNQAPLSY